MYTYATSLYASWWSWLISSAADAVYAFGFVSLCPQLYINYRLKSVAHLPWRAESLAVVVATVALLTILRCLLVRTAPPLARRLCRPPCPTAPPMARSTPPITPTSSNGTFTFRLP